MFSHPAERPETINGLNLYAYCGNNPVMATDESRFGYKSN